MAAIALVSVQAPAAAEGLISEMRIGVMDHDSSIFHNSHETTDPDINLEIRFASPDFLAWAFAPRPLIGGTINTGNGTSFGYAGLGWTFDLAGRLGWDRVGDPQADSDGETPVKDDFRASVGLAWSF